MPEHARLRPVVDGQRPENPAEPVLDSSGRDFAGAQREQVSAPASRRPKRGAPSASVKVKAAAADGGQRQDLEQEPPPSERTAGASEFDHDRSYGLMSPELTEWEGQPEETIRTYYAAVMEDYFQLINPCVADANTAIEEYAALSNSHRRWRIGTIVATGTLAAINVCAAFDLLRINLGELRPGTMVTLPMLLNAFAALYAGGLTVAGNLENFFNRGQTATGFRLSYELLLDHYREFRFKWFYYVHCYGPTAQGCANAGRLYRQLFEADMKLRQKLLQLTEGDKSRDPAKVGAPPSK